MDPVPSAENIQPSLEPLEISLPLPKSPHTTLHIHLTFLATSVMVFICTTVPGDSGAGEGGALNSMGSFVYAMPDRTNSRATISTTLQTSPASIDYTTRTAKILSRRMNAPVYVGCSIDTMAMGSTVEEEMEGFTKIIDVIMERWNEWRSKQ
ncbi:hypothetical protein Egran_06654 [Elaphomyces granulatus]|uniref:Uncharacterized protein n=1 Tax=Elaphomyces granulatus TaxID=519963 RepID=A0A232LNJ5_9EURO|nr:hypothetical protein Egran_06654 [Elaphomyces granulatus]